MIWKATIFGLLLCVAVDGGPAISEQNIVLHSGHHGELKHVGDRKPEHHDEYAWSYPSYEFSYKVKDPHTHDEKGQQEARHGDEVRGEYWLIEPDGRKRTVHYRAEKHTGFHAIVKYSGPLHHIRHKSKEDYKNHDEGNRGGEEEGEEEGRENLGGDNRRDEDDGSVGEDNRSSDEAREENREDEESQGNEKDNFWSFINFGKKDKKNEWQGKKEERDHNEEKSDENVNSREEGGMKAGKEDGLIGYHWDRKYDNGRERVDRGHEDGRGDEERGRDRDLKGTGKDGHFGYHWNRKYDSGRERIDGDREEGQGDEERGRGRDEKVARKGGRDDGGIQGNDKRQSQEGRWSNEDKQGGGQSGEEKGRGYNKGWDRDGLSSYQISMPYPKHIENFNARTYSHGRSYRAAPVDRQ